MCSLIHDLLAADKILLVTVSPVVMYTAQWVTYTHVQSCESFMTSSQVYLYIHLYMPIQPLVRYAHVYTRTFAINGSICILQGYIEFPLCTLAGDRTN